VRRHVDVIDAIKDRRTIRKFVQAEVNNKVLREILEAATLAPSAHNSQPTRFVVLRSTSTRRTLVEAMSRAFQSDLRRDGVAEAEIVFRVKESESRLLNAPVLVLVCLTMEDMHEYPDAERKSAEYTMAIQSAAAAIENLLLAAHARGLGGGWMCAPLFCKSLVQNALNLPLGYDPQAFVLIGQPGENPNTPERLRLDDVVALV
jgi:F420 biosynthesis protein FbiB-like protein